MPYPWIKQTLIKEVNPTMRGCSVCGVATLCLTASLITFFHFKLYAASRFNYCLGKVGATSGLQTFGFPDPWITCTIIKRKKKLFIIALNVMHGLKYLRYVGDPRDVKESTSEKQEFETIFPSRGTTVQ